MTRTNNSDQAEPYGQHAADPEAEAVPEVTERVNVAASADADRQADFGADPTGSVGDQTGPSGGLTDAGGEQAADSAEVADESAQWSAPEAQQATPEAAQQDASGADTPREDGSGNGSTPAASTVPSATSTVPSATSTVPSWKPKVTSGGEAKPHTVGLHAAQPAHAARPAHAAQPAQPAQPEQPPSAEQPKPASRPDGPAHRYPSSSAPTFQTIPRYGQSGTQPPPPTQSTRGADHNFSQPTVRIGGRIQSGPGGASSESSTSSTPLRSASTPRMPRRASLQLRYLEPWSVLKVSLVLSVAGFVAWMVAVGVLYSILAGMGVWDQLNGTYSDLTSVNEGQADDKLISAGGVFGVAALIGLVNIVLITAMCSVGAFIYNASADLAGGVEITLSELD